MKRFFALACTALLLLSGCTSTANTPIEAESTAKTESYTLSAFSMPTQTEYIYDYLGMRFSLSEDIHAALDKGDLLMFLDAGYDQSTQALLYARQAIAAVSQEDKEKIWHSKEEIQNWRQETPKLGYIGIYNKTLLETTDIATLTNCTTNKEIGESSDGTWVYYISSNTLPSLEALEDRLQKTLVTLYDMTPFVAGVSIFSEVRRNLETIGEIQTTDISGNTITTDIFADYDLTLVNVFATWCSLCLQEIPELEKVHTSLADQSINVIGIVYDAAKADGSIDDTIVEQAQKIHDTLGVTYNFILPDETLLSGRLQSIQVFPETFFVDRQGNIVGNYYLGARPYEDWMEVIAMEHEQWKAANVTEEATESETVTETTDITEGADTNV